MSQSVAIIPKKDRSIMSLSIMSQTWALVRRYLIHLRRSPTTSATRILIWPGLLLGFIYYLFIQIKGSDIVKDTNFAAFTPFLTLALTVFHFYHFINWLAKDREKGMKSLMVSMGLKRTSYYLAITICVLVTISPIIFCLSQLGTTYVFVETKSSIFAIIAMFLLFAIHLNGWIFVMASFFTTSKYTSLVYVLIFLQTLLHPGLKLLMKGSSKSMQTFILFSGCFSPYEGIMIFTESYDTCKNCDELQYNDKDQISEPTALILTSMAFWSVIAYAFARWFEEVCPWQNDTAVKNPFFCITGCFSKKNSNAPHDVPPSDSRYFQQHMNNREVGVKISRINKSFRGIKAVNDLSFEIYKGETTLLLGHNGAGKTTLMNMILGKLSPDDGQVKISGSDENHLGVGICPQESILDDELNVTQHLELFADIKNSTLSSSSRNQHIKTTLNDIGMIPHLNKLPSELSGGMKRKLSLGMAFVGQSSILILDEPSSGLDPDSRVFIWNAIRRYRADRTVLLSTQHMEEADYLGDRIAIMSSGRIVCCGSSTFLNSSFGSGYKLRIECMKSRRGEILALIQQHFKSATTNIADVPQSSRSSPNDTIVDMIVELGDNTAQNLDHKMIQLLEAIESQSQALGIVSHGLKSSSLEDVLLNTDKHFNTESDAAVRATIESTSGHINTLTKSLHSDQSNYSIVCALLMKHINTYKRDWFSLLVFRIGLPVLVLYVQVRIWGTELNPVLSYKPNYINSFLIMHFIYYPTAERSSKFKTMQLTSSANFTSYWLSQLMIDIPTALIAAIILNTIFGLAFNGKILVSSFEIHLILTMAILLFELASAIACYLLSHLFSVASQAPGIITVLFGATFLLNILLQLISITLRTDLEWLSTTVFRVASAVVPNDAFSFLIYGLGSHCYVNGIPIECRARSGFSPVVYGFIALVAQIICYSALLFIIESNNIDVRSYFNMKNWFCFKTVPNSTVSTSIDSDVAAESAKALNLIRNPQVETHSLIAASLNKSYIVGQRVIDDLSFTVNRSECFGLLGVNGAGKTTTFSMIVAELKPDKGRIWLNGVYDTYNVDIYRTKLGYDPQATPEMALSPYEALTLMARLRNVSSHTIPMLVHSTLEVLQMAEHTHKSVRSLSGGTKRKLALGMSFIGNPSLLALDEPTAGVDPIARRSIWQLLKSLRGHSGVSVVISSHAMEECEAICDRIAIMAAGKLRCIGSFLHLRSKFSQGCSIRVQFSSDVVESSYNSIETMINELKAKLEQVSASIKLVDKNVNSATFNISDDKVKKSVLFKALKQYREQHPNMSYMINDSSLEDIFIALAKEQQEISTRRRL